MGEKIPVHYSPRLPVSSDAVGWLACNDEERKIFERFVTLMANELAANAAKGNRPAWLQMDRKQAIAEIHWHLSKLAVAAKLNDEGANWNDPFEPQGSDDQRADKVRELGADVANCALMAVDVMGLLGTTLEQFCREDRERHDAEPEPGTDRRSSDPVGGHRSRLSDAGEFAFEVGQTVVIVDSFTAPIEDRMVDSRGRWYRLTDPQSIVHGWYHEDRLSLS